MTTIIGIRDIARNVNLLKDYDYVDLEDKKTHEYKGLFVSPKYAEEFKQYLKSKIIKEREDKLNRIKKYAGKGSLESTFEDLSSSEISKRISSEKLSE